MTTHGNADGSPSGVTLHLVPESVWLDQAAKSEYRPERFDEEGLIHCTDEDALVIEVGNRYYRDDPRPFLVLDVDLSRVAAPAVYDDEARVYPHVYGPIEHSAILRVRRVARAPDGTFVAIGPTVDDTD